MEAFLCSTLDEGTCKKIPWWKFFKSLRQDIKENRILEIDKDYSMDDWWREHKLKSGVDYKEEKQKEHDRRNSDTTSH